MTFYFLQSTVTEAAYAYPRGRCRRGGGLNLPIQCVIACNAAGAHSLMRELTSKGFRTSTVSTMD